MEKKVHEPKKPNFNLKLPEDLLTALKAIAIEREVEIADLIRSLIVDHFDIEIQNYQRQILLLNNCKRHNLNLKDNMSSMSV